MVNLSLGGVEQAPINTGEVGCQGNVSRVERIHHRGKIYRTNPNPKYSANLQVQVNLQKISKNRV